MIGSLKSSPELPPESSSSSTSSSDSAEKTLARDLLQLNLDDRNAITEEIHGVGCLAPEESPELLRKSVQDFWAAVSALSDSQTIAYRECKRIAIANRNRDYNYKHYAIDDPNFPLRFLRCELFDIPKAALRYTNYLTLAHELWGRIALEREIRFSDFTKTEAKIFRKGIYQLLPIRDQAGRRVFVGARKLGDESNFDEVARIKVIFYLWNSISSHDIETQRKGAIVLADICAWGGINNESWKTRLLYIKLAAKHFQAIPTRIVAIHVCAPNTTIARLLHRFMVLNFGSQAQRVRFRVHLKNTCKGLTFDRSKHEAETWSCECCGELYIRYQLKTYGIPTDLLPFTDSGTITTKNHTIWTKSRKYFEEGAFEVDAHGNGSFKVLFSGQSGAVSIVDCPGSNDILFRQGKTMMEHPGNAMFRGLILDYLERDRAWKANQTLLGETEGGGGTSFSASETTETMPQYGKQWFLNSWILDEICIRRKGRFLEWDKDRCVWTLLKDLKVVKHKISVVYSKYRNRQESLLKNATAATAKQRKRFPIDRSSDDGCNDDTDTRAAMAYQFLEGRMTAAASSQRDAFCDPCRNACGSIPSNAQASSSPIPSEVGFAPPSASSNLRKRARED